MQQIIKWNHYIATINNNYLLLQVALMSDKPKQLHALKLLFLLIPDSHYQLLKDTLLLLHATADEVSH
jgi:hypothetical protein